MEPEPDVHILRLRCYLSIRIKMFPWRFLSTIHITSVVEPEPDIQTCAATPMTSENTDNNRFLDAFCQLSILPMLWSQSQTFIYFATLVCAATPMTSENTDNNRFLDAFCQLSIYTTNVVEPEPDVHILRLRCHLSIRIKMFTWRFLSTIHTTSVVEPEPDIQTFCNSDVICQLWW